MNNPVAEQPGGILSAKTFTEEQGLGIPAFAGMTMSQQAARNYTQRD